MHIYYILHPPPPTHIYIHTYTHKYTYTTKRSYDIKCYTDITFGKVVHFISSLFNPIYVEFLIHGNMTASDAYNIAFLIGNKLSNIIPLMPTSLELYHDIDDGK